jgi:tetratricopeptide (TPR) repeat protein
MNHPTTPVLRAFLRSLSVADAGLLLHLLECPRCSRRAWKELSPRPLRRRPGEPRSEEQGESTVHGMSAEPERRPEETLAPEPGDACRDLARQRRGEGRFEEALALHDRAARLFSRSGRPADQAVMLGDLAVLHLELRQEEEALAALERMLALGPAAPDPGLAAGSTASLAGALAGLEDPLEGRRLLALLRERLGRRRAVQQRMDLLRQEGLLAAFTRQEHQAERFLRDAWTGFLRAGLPGHAALAVVDLASLFLRQGRPPALRDLGVEARRSLRGRELSGPVRTIVEDLLPQLEAGQISADTLAAAAVGLARKVAVPPDPDGVQSPG